MRVVPNSDDVCTGYTQRAWPEYGRRAQAEAMNHVLANTDRGVPRFQDANIVFDLDEPVGMVPADHTRRHGALTGGRALSMREGRDLAAAGLRRLSVQSP